MRAALKSGRRICVYGDYDVDGVTAAAILYLHLTSLGADVRAYLPRPATARATASTRRPCARWRRTPTCSSPWIAGVNAVDMAALAKELGMDIVITDHHRPGANLPDCPLVDPLLNGYPCPHLSGAGVAFKLVEALSGRAAAMEYVDLAALSTVADVVPLLGENPLHRPRGTSAHERGAEAGPCRPQARGRAGGKDAHRRASGLSAGAAPQRRWAAGQRAAGGWNCSSPPTLRAPKRWPWNWTPRTVSAARWNWPSFPRRRQCWKVSTSPALSRHRAGARGLEHRRIGAGGLAAGGGVSLSRHPLERGSGRFEGLLPFHPRRGHLFGADRRWANT